MRLQRPTTQGWWRRLAIAAALTVAALLVLRWAPHASLQSQMPLSTLVLDMRGEPLRMTLADDGQLRLWTPLAQIPVPLVEAVLLHEDQHFYWHPGVNPVALVRATLAVVTGGAHQGASTITMQLVRLLQRHNTRSVGDKLQQIAGALWLEARYSKREILEAYLNLAPYGGNVQGVGAASRLSFGKPVQDLDLAQRLALAVLPQAPQARAPDRIESDSLHAARLRLFARWLQRHPDDARLQALVESPLRFTRTPLPFAAPHFTTMALKQATQVDGTVRTTLDARLQALLERRLREHLQPLKREGIRNASALLIDTRSMAIRAWLGSADYFDPSIEGQVDGVLARRSPGSTLKPVLYALAMDQGLIHPLTVLKDAPTSFGPFTPENSDGRFLGPITAHDALIRSRNVPAVQLSAALGDPTLYRFLKTAGVHLPKSERHYGLALTLGGGEVSMVELAQLYAMLANRGVYHEARWQSDLPEDTGRPLLSEAASYMVLDILRDNPRPDEAQSERASRRALMPAWKTGTSWGFHDAWTAGVIGPYVLVVWVGNFNGEANPAFVGVQVAAPLFFDLADALRTYAPIEAAPSYRTPPRIARVEVCAASGDLPNAECPHRATTWFIPGVSPIRVSNVHRRVRIDTRTGRQACADTPASEVREEVFEFWPSDLMRLYAQAGLPRRAPPLPGDCESAIPAPGAGFTAVSTGPRNGLSGTRPPQIVSPLAGVSYPIAAEALGNEVIPLQANADGAARTLYWFANGSYLGAAKPGEVFAWKPLRTGRFDLSVTDDLGASDERTAQIRLR